MGYEIVGYQEMEKKALAVAKSGLFGVKTPEQAIALFLVAEAEGIPIMQAVLDYHIIDNKPSLKADAMLRRFQASGGVIRWVDRSDKKVSAYFSHPSCPEPILIDWDFERAAKAGLSTRTYKSGEPNMWMKFPRQMLTARVISEGIRATAPGAASGIYTPEEVVDFKPAESHPDPVQSPKNAIRDPEAVDAHITSDSTPIDNSPVETKIAQPVEPLSAKSKANFLTAMRCLGDAEYIRILKAHGYEFSTDIKHESVALAILREMRQAFENKPKAEVSK